MILITGIAGFIGSHLGELLLSKGEKLIGIDNFDTFYSREVKENNIKNMKSNPNFIFMEGDICDFSFISSIFSKFEIDTVIHLAAKAGVRQSIVSPFEYYKVNVNGTLTILENMKTYNVKKLIFASSSSVYGNNDEIPFKESDKVDFPISPYAATKKTSELITYNYFHLYGISSINLRFFTVYGERQRPDLAIHKFFKSIYNNIPIEIYGDGSSSRDYTYINDIIKGIENSIVYLNNNKKVYEICNLGNNYTIKLLDLLDLIEKTTNRKFIKHFIDTQLGDVKRTYADITKSKNILNYHPEFSIENGLKLFKNWYEKNL